MTLKRRLAAIITIATSLVVLAGVVPANATPAVSPWVQSIATDMSTTSTATATWNVTTHALTLKLVTGTLATGKCVTVFFDWTATGHHDARARRDCKSMDTFTGSFTDDDPSNITGGPQKLGVCYGPDDKQGTCIKADGLTGSVPMDWTPWPASPPPTPSQCTVSWIKRSATGVFSSFIDPHSQNDSYVGSSC